MQTRSKGGYIPSKFKGNSFEKSFFPNTLKLWNSLPKDIQYKDLYEFKMCIKERLKPRKYKHLLGKTLLTKKLFTLTELYAPNFPRLKKKPKTKNGRNTQRSRHWQY